MFRPTKLLKVVSVIMIIFTALALVFTAIGFAMIPQIKELPGMDTSLIESAYSPFNIVLTLISSISCLAAAIFALSGKSYKSALTAMVIYTLVIITSTVQTAMTTGFLFTQIFGYILPVLYWWGLYQSKE